ncbi:protein ENDOPLASMIC RETICULUM-ARRESTED PEN3 [Phragmites australis]|uniref:protein ENDOPLASMIC RETICULUM-ARRESTED PEN3 n=1 Tax=Phragmites australis TaxID=29695 RepID=UPI002D768CFB|nr:protein ENDOPLASMIC RETICULUM-ARRESTED PEN3 [Phragmites australis]
METVGGCRSGAVKQLNVGGKLFALEASSLSLSLSLDSPSPSPSFVDRDPALLSAVLSAIRSPYSAAPAFPAGLLLDEAHFYGLHAQLLAALSPPPLRGFSASLASTLSPHSEPFPTALAPHHDGSLCLAHGAGQVTYYSPALDHLATFRTHLHSVTSLRQLPPTLAVLGSSSAPGLHVYDFLEGRHVATLQWSDPTDLRVGKAKVIAIAARPPADGADKNSPILATFECPHRENCILAVDPVTLKPTLEIGRQSGSGAKSSVPDRVVHLQELGLVFASSVSVGAFGYSGYMRLWDIRSGSVVWETSEPGGTGRSSRFGDPFADADVDVKQLTLYKVCSKSGDVAAADLRCLGNDPWVYMSSGPRGSGGGHGSVLHCFKSQAFVSRKDGLEVWSRLEEWGCDTGNLAEQTVTKQKPNSEAISERSFRSCYMDTEEDAKRGMIQMMEGGGDRLFVTREDMQGVEVWESSRLAGALSLS